MEVVGFQDVVGVDLVLLSIVLDGKRKIRVDETIIVLVGGSGGR